jgi:outer membrane protein OmpA-like peptidoglycan-associated protein
MIELADGLTQGRGDGRISINDAKNLLRVVKDANNYSDIEKQTMEYIRKNYKFTKEGDEFFRTEIRKWAASKPQKSRAELAIAQNATPGAVEAPTNTVKKAERSPAALAKSDRTEAKSPVAKKLLIALLGLLVLAVLIYFLFYRSGFIATKTVGAPPVLTPATKPARAPAAAASAELREFVAAQKISFDSGKTDLTAASARTLDALAERLKKEPARILVKGHSCVLGSKALNQKISERRAQVVKAALIRRGVAADSIQARGVADSEPAGDNRTAAGRIASRRVTFSVIP